jgi:GLPGLI family protein
MRASIFEIGWRFLFSLCMLQLKERSNILFSAMMFALLSVGCTHLSGGKDEGTIEYEIRVIKNDNPIITTDLLPSTMLTRFKNNCMAQELAAGMGMFATTFISDPEKNMVWQTLQMKMFGKNYVCEADSKILRQTITAEGKRRFEFLPSIRSIAGYNCKLARMHFVDGSHPPVDIYYTEEIPVQQPNFYSFYKEIPGVLMDFEVKRYNIEMHLVATKVTHDKVDDKILEPDADAKRISLVEMNAIFNGGKP